MNAITYRQPRSTRSPSSDEAGRRSNRFANVLGTVLGLGKGDRLYILCDREPDVEMALAGALKAGVEARAFRPDIDVEELKSRLETGKANAILATLELFESKVEDAVPAIATLHHILIAGEPLEALMRSVPAEYGDQL